MVKKYGRMSAITKKRHREKRAATRCANIGLPHIFDVDRLSQFTLFIFVYRPKCQIKCHAQTRFNYEQNVVEVLFLSFRHCVAVELNKSCFHFQFGSEIECAKIEQMRWQQHIRWKYPSSAVWMCILCAIALNARPHDIFARETLVFLRFSLSLCLSLPLFLSASSVALNTRPSHTCMQTFILCRSFR